MIFRVFLIILISVNLCSCLFTAGLIHTANEKTQRYSVFNVTKAFSSNNNVYFCFDGYTGRANSGTVDKPLTSYVTYFNPDSLENKKPELTVLERECTEFIKNIKINKNIKIYIIDRDIECSINVKCRTFNYNIKNNEKIAYSGTYDKRPYITTMSLETQSLINELKTQHSIDEAIYSIKGVTSTSYSNVPFSIYYRSNNLMNKYGNTRYISMENVSYGEKLYLYLLLPLTVPLDIITFPIQIFMISYALNDPYN